MSAIFNFQSLLTVILLLICTCAYIRALAPNLLDKNKTGPDARLLVDLRSVGHLLSHFRPREARQSSVVLPSVIFCFMLPRRAVGRHKTASHRFVLSQGIKA
ncbi:hypothetical protein cypCar_00046372 [Cyprinus carpio]|nr:hypothetical protein cypCar_00046372 [Cyprinus carpio]